MWIFAHHIGRWYAKRTTFQDVGSDTGAMGRFWMLYGAILA